MPDPTGTLQQLLAQELQQPSPFARLMTGLAPVIAGGAAATDPRGRMAPVLAQQMGQQQQQRGESKERAGKLAQVLAQLAMQQQRMQTQQAEAERKVRTQVAQAQFIHKYLDLETRLAKAGALMAEPALLGQVIGEMPPEQAALLPPELLDRFADNIRSNANLVLSRESAERDRITHEAVEAERKQRMKLALTAEQRAIERHTWERAATKLRGIVKTYETGPKHPLGEGANISKTFSDITSIEPWEDQAMASGLITGVATGTALGDWARMTIMQIDRASLTRFQNTLRDYQAKPTKELEAILLSEIEDVNAAIMRINDATDSKYPLYAYDKPEAANLFTKFWHIISPPLGEIRREAPPTLSGEPPGGTAQRTFSSPEEVREAYQRGELSKDEATRMLRDQFGMK